MFSYAFIYTDSRLKETLMDPLGGLIWIPLTINQISNNNPKTKKKIIKIQKSPS